MFIVPQGSPLAPQGAGAQNPISALLAQLMQHAGAGGGFHPGQIIGIPGGEMDPGRIGLPFLGDPNAGGPQRAGNFTGHTLMQQPGNNLMGSTPPGFLHAAGNTQYQGAIPGGQQFRPADLLHAAGNDQAAAQTYMQHHPGMFRGTATNVPGYVTKQALGNAGRVGSAAGSGRQILDQLARARAVAQTMQHLRRLRPADAPGQQ